jgi:DNA modification methylase
MIIEKKKIADLIPAPYNPRQSTAKQEKHLKESLEKFGLVEPIIFNKQTGYIVGGHFRVRELKKLGIKEIECVIVDLNEADEKELNIRLNANTGSWDWDTLANDWDVVDLDKWGLEIPQFDTVEELEASEDDYEVPEGGMETDIVIGDLFEIGEHRLLCGDSTDSDAVARLMNGEKADMVFTSPPYNSGGNSGTGGYRGNQNRETKDFYHEQEKSDNWTKEEYFNFSISILNNISVHTKDNTPILWNIMYNANSRDDYGKIVFSELNPFKVKETIIWDKGVGMNICSTGILSRTCELIFLMSKGEKYYTNQDNEVYWNVWRISNKQGENMKWGHGASFPIELPFEGINKFSAKSAIIYEPFTGSGTTMVAAHQLKRKCYGMELDPKYCQVIIDRMRKLDSTLIIKRNGVELKTAQ